MIRKNEVRITLQESVDLATLCTGSATVIIYITYGGPGSANLSQLAFLEEKATRIVLATSFICTIAV